MIKFLVIFEKTDTGYSAYVPDLPGCIATGKTKSDCESNIYKAIKFHIEGFNEEGLSIPDQKTESEFIVIN
ncbi:MAG TPA: type II toxin-antitoxin system HicB family antitoxin [bacterium]|nr:type II toxin-antitoxin system HicB family antitoxin [bacterium]